MTLKIAVFLDKADTFVRPPTLLALYVVRLQDVCIRLGHFFMIFFKFYVCWPKDAYQHDKYQEIKMFEFFFCFTPATAISMITHNLLYKILKNLAICSTAQTVSVAMF